MFASLPVKLLAEGARQPYPAGPNEIGADLFANSDVFVPSKGRALVPTGVAVAIPDGHYGRIAPRSGLAANHGLDVGAGVIDPSYRGEIKVVIFNHGSTSYKIERGDKIAQLILERASIPRMHVVEDLDETDRGDRGFGSTDA